MAHVLLQRPRFNGISMASHKDLLEIIDEYAIDPDFKDVMFAIGSRKIEKPFHVKDGYLL